MTDQGKSFNIRVVGDLTRDILTDDNQDISQSDGGALFVEKMLRNCGLSESIKILGYEIQSDLALPTTKWDVKKYDVSQQNKVYRYSCNQPYSSQEIESQNQDLVIGLTEPKEKFHMLVLENLWTQNGFLWREEWKNIKEFFSPIDNSPLPSLILMINKRIPKPRNKVKAKENDLPRLLERLNELQTNTNCSQNKAEINELVDSILDIKFWQFFEEIKDFHKNTLAVVYADILRWHGFTISKKISWERTAQDYLAEFFTNPIMKSFSELQHFVVRFGITGAIHSYRLGKDSDRRLHRLFFDPKAKKIGIFRDTKIDGDMIGHQSILVASIVKELTNTVKTSNNQLEAESSQFEISEIIGKAISNSLCRSQDHFDHGIPINSTQDFMYNGGFNNSIFNIENQSLKRIANERIPVGNPSWNILIQSSEYQLLNVAQDIAKYGVDEVLNSGNIRSFATAPIIRFGEKEELIIVDRREIESYISVYSMIEKFVVDSVNKLEKFERSDDQKTPSKRCLERPISIVLFGPPGSGKSFTAKSLYKSIPQKPKIRFEFVPFNLSQIKNPDILSKFFDPKAEYTDIDSLIGKLYLKWKEGFQSELENSSDEKEQQLKFKNEIKNCIPFIFFDEFDSDLDGKEVGWLKYFLSPMEDLKASDYGFLTPVFFFAGGTSRNYLDFAREDLSLNETQKADFKLAKGTDFVSRLSGHINILGIDPVDEFDEAYVIRRAILLRSLIEQQFPSVDAVSPPIIHTMLRVSQYKHGARSMRALLSIFRPLGEEQGKVVFSSLPTLPQLNMHVDGQEFLSILQDEARLHMSN